jgi:4-hydroxythreonine-4-phosphate dehydrogenase
MEKNSQNKYVIGITQGDINGIGYEIVFKALADAEVYDNFTIVIYGSPKIAAYHRKLLNINNITVNNANSATELAPNSINIINVCDENTRVEIGSSSIQAGECSVAAINRAQSDLKNGLIDMLVTLPVNGFNVFDAGFRFAGISEALAQEFNCKNFIITFVGEKLKVATVTSAMPIAKISENLTSEKILWKIRTLDKALKDDFTIRKPKIAVLGLNPFASDYNVFGIEEGERILPAIERANEEGITCFGPYSPEGFFASGAYSKFDAVLAMYYDQAMLSFRLIEGNKGIFYTAGLPVVCTSTVHGPAYDIAGKDMADDTSFKNALYTAIDIYNARKILDGITPLKRQAELEADKKIC